MVTQTVSDAMRTTDFVARIGGDEVVIFLPETDESQAKSVLGNVRESLMHPLIFRTYKISVSIGAIIYSQVSSSLNEMLEEAYVLMNLLKTEGKNAVHICNISAIQASANSVSKSFTLRTGKA